MGRLLARWGRMRQHTNARDALAAISAIPVVDLIACNAITTIENVQYVMQ
jgi:hypothetical protein